MKNLEIGDLVYIVQNNEKIYGRITSFLPFNPSFGYRAMINLLEPQSTEDKKHVVTHLCVEKDSINNALDELERFVEIDICSEDGI